MTITRLIEQLQYHLKDSGDLDVRMEPEGHYRSIPLTHVTRVDEDGQRTLILEEL